MYFKTLSFVITDATALTIEHVTEYNKLSSIYMYKYGLTQLCLLWLFNNAPFIF
jgi:predicted kinase